MVKPELAQITVAPEESQFETTDVTFITTGTAPPEIWIVGVTVTWHASKTKYNHSIQLQKQTTQPRKRCCLKYVLRIRYFDVCLAKVWP